MSGSKVLLLPGQGAQVVGMAKAWVEASPEARAVFAEADAALAGHLPALPGTGEAAGGSAGAGGARHEREATLSELCFNGPAELLNRTDVSQPAIYAAGVACWRGLLAKWGMGQNAGISEAGVVATAGLSLGEYTALHIAGAFSFADGLRLVALRGRAMQDAAEASQGGMVALIGADEAQAQQVCDETLAAGVSAGVTGEVLVCANFNAPGQIVISGSKSACDRAAAADGPAVKLGLRATALTVAGAFHSPLMAPAAERLRAALETTKIQAPRCTVIANVTAKPHEGGADAHSIRRMLVLQLTSPVRWAQSAALLASTYNAAGGTPAEFHELAPGKTLMGLMRRIDKATKVTSHDEPSGP
jgi:[acyl-carrier-protein] S-malonyltransferase